MDDLPALSGDLTEPPDYMSVFAHLACMILLSTQQQTQPSTAPSTYLLGPEDVITVTVLRHSEFSSDYVVPPNGSLDMPFGGSIKVAGKTVSDISTEITNLLKARLLKPEVSVTVRSMRIQRFYVVGDVKLSGIFDLKPGWGVAEGLSAAGGLNPDIQQQDTQVTLEHVSTGEKVTMTLDQALLKSSDPSLKIQSGDVLRIESVFTFPVYITGKVKNPGVFRMRVDSTGLLAAIAQAGGTTDDGSIKNVRIIHADGKEEVANLVPAIVHGDSSKLPTLRSGDMIVVPVLLEKIVVLGYVAKPGYFPIPDGQTFTLSDAVGLAGGQAPRARFSRVGVLRIVNGQQTKKVYDLGKFFVKGDITQNPVMAPGDVVFVPETNKADLQTIFGGLTAGAITYYYSKQ